MPAPAATRRARRPNAPALSFDQRLVLSHWMLNLLEEDSFIPPGPSPPRMIREPIRCLLPNSGSRAGCLERGNLITI